MIFRVWKRLYFCNNSILKRCVNDSKSEIYDNYCKSNGNDEKCPVPDKFGGVMPARKSLGKITCGYCCAKSIPCNTFRDGRLTSVEVNLSELFRKGYRSLDSKKEALSRIVAFSINARQNVTQFRKFMADSAFVFMLVAP